MAFDFDYRFTDKAEQDFDGILHYIFNDLNNSTAAQAFNMEVFNRIDTLRRLPDTGTLVDNEFLPDKEVRKVLIDNYTLYYKSEKDNKLIVIIRIAYSKRNLDEILRTL